MRELMALTKALADENRVRMLLALGGRELCVCQVVELFGLSPSTISKHLSILRNAGLVEGRKAGRWVFYHLPKGGAPVAATEAVSWVRKSLEKNPRILEDRRKLARVLKMDAEEICRRISKK